MTLTEDEAKVVRTYRTIKALRFGEMLVKVNNDDVQIDRTERERIKVVKEGQGAR